MIISEINNIISNNLVPEILGNLGYNLLTKLR